MQWLVLLDLTLVGAKMVSVNNGNEIIIYGGYFKDIIYQVP